MWQPTPPRPRPSSRRITKRPTTKKRKYVEVLVGDKVWKYNTARAGRKNKSDLGPNYTGPYVVEEVVGQRLRLRTIEGKILKTLVQINNVKLQKQPQEQPQEDVPQEQPREDEPLEQPQEDEPQEDEPQEDEPQEQPQEDEPQEDEPQEQPQEDEPQEQPQEDEPQEDVPQEDEPQEQPHEDELLTASSTTSAFIKTLSDERKLKPLIYQCEPTSIMETLMISPPFLNKETRHSPLKKNERMVVAGEGIEPEDLKSVKGNNWINDKVLNGYAKLLGRESTDFSMDGISRRLFIVPTYAAALWDAGVYDNYLFKKVDFSMYDYIAVPWHVNGNHWVVLVAQTKDNTVTVYDSLGGDNDSLIEKFGTFMKKRSSVLGMDVPDLKAGSPPVNRQKDGSSCGVFVLMVLECLVQGRPSWILRQAHVPMFRKYIAARLLVAGDRHMLDCNALVCNNSGGATEWVNCDVCGRWVHLVCCSKVIVAGSDFKCEICDAQYS